MNMNIHLPVFKRTRLAPTPSGYLHLGNVLSFVLTVTLARQTAAKILLRIDDLDRGRANPIYIRDIFDTLNFLEIPWDEGPRNLQEFESEWSQLHRMPLYREGLQQLKGGHAVFACTCSRAQVRRLSAGDIYPRTCCSKQLSLDTNNAGWRLKTDIEKQLSVKTISGEIIRAVLPAAMRYFVVRKKDGYPAYQLSSLMDDVHFGVDMIVRGQDLWASTLAQQYLAEQLGANIFTCSAFYHHPLLMASGGRKLSKSAGDNSVHYLRTHGKTAADIYTAIAHMVGFKGLVKSWEELGQLLLN
jgi:glutamyl-tRNA synthetase